MRYTILAGNQMSKIFSVTKDNDDIPVLMLSKPLSSEIVTQGGQFLYCLVDFRAISVLLRDNNMEATGEVYLVNKEGLFLSTSRFGAKILETKISMKKTIARR